MKSFSCPRYVHWPILSLLYQTRRKNPLSIQRVDMVYITSLWYVDVFRESSSTSSTISSSSSDNETQEGKSSILY